jgi:hypothetical protein
LSAIPGYFGKVVLQKDLKRRFNIIAFVMHIYERLCQSLRAASNLNAYLHDTDEEMNPVKGI